MARAVELDSCSYSYGGSVPALVGVNCSIEAGSWVAIVGENGSGKSTLARLCNGLVRPQEGRIRILGRDIRGRSVGDIARDVGYLFQNPDHQIFASTVREEIAFGLRNLGLPAADRVRRVDEALCTFDLNEHAERPPAMLGYGLRRQVTVASLFVCRPSILILDEATTGLDGKRTQVLLERLGEQQEAGRTILFITHDTRLVAEWASHVLVLHRGELLAQGTVKEILARPRLLARASVSPPPITRLSQRLRCAGMKGDSLTVRDFYREFTEMLPPGGG